MFNLISALINPSHLFGVGIRTLKPASILQAAFMLVQNNSILGKSVYAEYCMACHGVDGKGNGVASKGLVPPPRNFTLGLYKFGKVVAGDLPHDEDMTHIFNMA